MRTHKISIMGQHGSFHEKAAAAYFGHQDIEIVPGNSFVTAVKAVKQNECDYCVLAIENSIAGTILPNYVLAGESGLRIIGEIFLPVELHLMASQEAELSQIKHIKSHPMALYQSAPFLSTLKNVVLTESPDTVSAAKEVANSKQNTIAAIAASEIAEKYGLKILKSNIESNQNNYTRFWILSKGETINAAADKASVCFHLEDIPGALSKLLNVFSRNLVNFTRVQSIPLPDEPGTFRFYADLEWPEKNLYLQSLKKAARCCKTLQVLGEYKTAYIPKRNSVHSLQQI